jgi:hypothetical protein
LGSGGFGGRAYPAQNGGCTEPRINVLFFQRFSEAVHGRPSHGHQRFHGAVDQQAVGIL